MKQLLALLMLTLLVSLLALPTLAETELTDVHCAEQAYSTKMPANASTTFQEENGLRIWLDEPGYVPNVLIWRRTDAPSDPEAYVRDEYTSYMKKQYGSKLVGTSLYEYYDIGGKRLLGASYIYKGSSGASINQLHLYEVRDDGHVEYHARYLNSEREATLAALDAAVRYYQPDAGKDKGSDDLVDVHCEEQGYTTKMPSYASTTFQEGNGLRIWLDEPGYVPNVLIWRRNSKLDDPETYVRDEYTDYMKKQYGSKLVGTTLFEYYDIGGKRLLGASYIYKSSSGASINQLHLYEARDDGHVEYNARYVGDEREATLAALDAAVRYYEPDQTGGKESTSLEDITCREQQFSTKIPSGLSSVFQEGNGLRIWLDEPGYVPNIVISRRSENAADPEKYMTQEYPAYMKERYEDKLVGTTLHEYYDIGGKHLLGSSYIYMGSAGYPINQLHLYEIRDDGHVEYHARYHNSERETALAALDTVVRYYQAEAETGASGQAPGAPGGRTSGSGRSSKSSGASGDRQLNISAKQPIVSKTLTVKDSRFSMKLPENWKILTASDYMTFCYKAWDPSSPNRTVFMFMKLEPFLKSKAARDMYRQIADKGYEMYRISSYYPVMESCSLKGFLDALPETIDFAARYYQSGLTINPNVIPDINKVKILEKKPSPLPCPNTCKENSIARISYKDSKGQSCEGLVTAQPIDPMVYYMYGVDAWPYTVYLFTGVTCPVGELNELEPVLTDCLSSFNFEKSYVQQAVGLSRAETETLLQCGQQMQAAHDAMVDAWSARQKSYDISSQKMSDAILGYDRLYDSETGEIYRAEIGFYDSYDLHRQEYSNSNLQLIDSSSQNYYLEGIDYYITK